MPNLNREGKPRRGILADTALASGTTKVIEWQQSPKLRRRYTRIEPISKNKKEIDYMSMHDVL